MAQEVRLTYEGPLARITLDRPPLNVLTTAMLEQLASSFEEAAHHEQVRLIRLDAVGKAFSAGVDVNDHVDDKVKPMVGALARLFDVLERIPWPTVSVVQGAALGGGCELILGTDLCLASSRARFGQPEIRLGLFAPPASVLLPRIVGERRALGLLLSGDTISAAEAERIGLVNAVYPEEAFEQEADSFLRSLLGHSAVALRLAKHAVRLGRGLSVDEAHRAVNRSYMDQLMTTADPHEGLAAFMEKREPVWKHR